MNASKLLLMQLGIVAVLAALHITGFNYFLYWRFHWFDILTHLLGGMWAAVFAAWVQSLRQAKLTPAFCIVVVLVMGVVWELFETATGSTYFPSDTLDTIKDLLMDVIGSIAAIILFRLIPKT